ncbi:Hypothetical predicted protein [Cloeon dipterum]|uniref:Heparan-alpha-glucosaminide N-acetyltransferase catalytic domain-containing protein n=1 Tax=Cloeon dipterum TaxID=197152 RepID=A0A8S1C701_9INSE|nr:Hypothetical predicted protein [Cloeon dipterum]
MIPYTWIEGRSWEPIRGLQLHDLGLDQAFLNLSSRLSKNTWVYFQRQPCFKCTQYSLLSEVAAHNSSTVKISSVYDLDMLVLNENAGTTYDLVDYHTKVLECSHQTSFGEFGIYDLIISANGNKSECRIETIQPPVDIVLPMFAVAMMSIIFLILTSGCYFLWKYWNRWHKADERKSDTESNSEYSTINKGSSKVKKLTNRLKSLDAFRGVCVVLLLFSNGFMGGYQNLGHAVWQGMPIAELPFPWFLWITAVCIPLKFKSVLANGEPRGKIVLEIFKRFVFLFVLGLMVNSVIQGVQLETIRYYGVLQRIAFMCLFAGGIFVLSWPKNYKEYSGCHSDIRVLLPQWVIHGVVHLLYLCLVFFLPIPGCPTGYVGPGGISEGGKYFNCTGGTFGYVDRLLHDERHLFDTPTTKDIYKVKVFDPEGPFSNLPSLLTMILGVQAGTILVMHHGWSARKNRLLSWGFFCIFLGLVLHFSNVIPINKQLWNTSYSLVTAGGAFICFTFYIYLIDKIKLWNGFPLVSLGLNCLALYIGSKFASNILPWHFAYGKMDTHFFRLIDSCWSVFIWTLIAIFLHKKKIIISA